MLRLTKSGINSGVDHDFDGTEQIELPYQVRIENFEGPLDLLLHLIKKSEINIYDIPIHLITQQYLTYIEAMEELNLTVAGEFLVMAATLLQIKSKMLLPAEEVEADEEDGPDPREELVRRLLEYKKFKDAARQLDEHEQLWREIYSREQSQVGAMESDETPLEDISLFDLVDVLQGILDRNPGKKLMDILPDNLTVRERMNAILEMLEGRESINFVDLFEQSCHRLVIIVTFLALLELMRLRTARVFQAEHFGPILVSRAFSLVPDPAEWDDAEWRGA
ncbi:MAG: segregation and condensation protein A [Nitrospiraceae bacterium]